MPNYSKIIHELRTKRKMTLGEIAKEIGASVKSVQNYENGTEPRDKKIAKKILELHENGSVNSANNTDYKEKVIELQDQIISQSKSKEGIAAEIGGKSFKINSPMHTFQALWAIEGKLNVLTDLIIGLVATGDAQKSEKIQKEVDEKIAQELLDLLDNYKASSAIDF